MNDAWLDAASPADLDAVAQALLDGKITPPFTASSIQLAGFAGAAPFLSGLGETETSMIAWMLRRLATERRRAEERYGKTARLVWSGPSDAGVSMRDTRMVLEGLFARAERHVFISTYVVHEGQFAFSALAKRLRERPGLEVEMYVNLPPQYGRPGGEVDYLETFARKNWYEDLPLPPLYYDTESLHAGDKRTSLHAKCVVIDGRWAFLTSANFTEAAQERNIEAGVLLDHPQIATALTERFHALRQTGRLQRIGRQRDITE